jgi:hypothetical protein
MMSLSFPFLLAALRHKGRSAATNCGEEAAAMLKTSVGRGNVIGRPLGRNPSGRNRAGVKSLPLLAKGAVNTLLLVASNFTIPPVSGAAQQKREG